MARTSSSTGGGQAKGGKSIAQPEWDALFGKPPVIDQEAMTGCELRELYRIGAGDCFKKIRRLVEEGKLEEVHKHQSGRLTKAYRPVKKGGK